LCFRRQEKNDLHVRNIFRCYIQQDPTRSRVGCYKKADEALFNLTENWISAKLWSKRRAADIIVHKNRISRISQSYIALVFAFWVQPAWPGTIALYFLLVVSYIADDLPSALLQGTSAIRMMAYG